MALYGPEAGPGKWYRFDDSYVEQVDESAAMTKGAYVLVYKRRGTGMAKVQGK
jgi:ubiquitin C-terminal hydrolase